MATRERRPARAPLDRDSARGSPRHTRAYATPARSNSSRMNPLLACENPSRSSPKRAASSRFSAAYRVAASASERSTSRTATCRRASFEPTTSMCAWCVRGAPFTNRCLPAMPNSPAYQYPNPRIGSTHANPSSKRLTSGIRSSTGLAISPGTDVLPMCSTATTACPHASAIRAHSSAACASQLGSCGTSTIGSRRRQRSSRSVAGRASIAATLPRLPGTAKPARGRGTRIAGSLAPTCAFCASRARMNVRVRSGSCAPRQRLAGGARPPETSSCEHAFVRRG